MIIRNFDESYTSPTVPPVETSVSSTPFHDKTLDQCCEAIKKLSEQDGADIDYRWLLVLDQQSLQDSTVLVVRNIEVDEDDFEPGELEGEAILLLFPFLQVVTL